MKDEMGVIQRRSGARTLWAAHLRILMVYRFSRKLSGWRSCFRSQISSTGSLTARVRLLWRARSA